MIEGSEDFFERLNSLGTGERAALKRSAGTMVQSADGRALKAFYRSMPSTGVRNEEKWFAIACLRCLWDIGEEKGEPFEAMISSLLRRDEISESTSHRVSTLLDTRWDQDGFMLSKLSRLVKMLCQKSEEMLDFPALLEDLIYWNSDTQTIQRKWARAMFGFEKNEKE
ncbi:MAG: type I-E CRISPR-associated protein Cse2/CasB [Lachnospiraceae bacterium]|nr:type I-E CRISPR-associated protein Cse2/CasB [Lachnospiraceae bacterium]